MTREPRGIGLIAYWLLVVRVMWDAAHEARQRVPVRVLKSERASR